MQSMNRKNMAFYLSLAAVGVGGYSLYRAGGDPKQAKDQAKQAVGKASSKLPRGSQAEKAGERVGEQANADIDEIVQLTTERAKNNDHRIAELTKEGIDKIDRIRHETARKMGTTVDNLDRAVEQKASEAKKSISGWFGGGK